MKLIKKYYPKTTEDLFISKENLLRLKRLILEKKPVIISGPTGAGKTTIAYLLAKEMDYNLFEINSSDTRNKNALETILIPSMKEGSLFSKGRLILIDDIDALSGTKDRGAIQTVISLLDEAKWPVIITTSNAYHDKLSRLRRRCGLIELDKIKDMQIFNLLKTICENEHILYDLKVLKELAERSQGDIRAALNDLGTFSEDNQLDSLDHLGTREKTEEIKKALHTVLKSKDFNKILFSFQNSDTDLGEALLWLDENLPKEYLKKEDLFKAYESLSKSDIFKGRIRKWQYWRFLVYQNFFLTVGVSFAKSRDYLSYSSYKRSGRLLKLFWAKQKNMKKKAIAEKIANKTHCSKKRALKDFSFIHNIYKNGKELDLNLSEEEINWLMSK